MVKVLILDDGYSSKNVVVKFGKNYKFVSLSCFLNSLCKRHDTDYEVRTAHLEDIESDETAQYFEALANTSLLTPALQSGEEFENLWDDGDLVDGIDLY